MTLKNIYNIRYLRGDTWVRFPCTSANYTYKINKNFGDWDNGNFIAFFEDWLDECFRILKHNLFLFTRFKKIQYFAKKYPEEYQCTLIWHRTTILPYISRRTPLFQAVNLFYFSRKGYSISWKSMP